MESIRQLAEISTAGYVVVLDLLSPTCARMEIRCTRFGGMDLRVYASDPVSAFVKTYTLWKDGACGIYDFTPNAPYRQGFP